MIVLLRKVLLLIILVFFTNNPHVQSLLGLLIIIAALAIHCIALPFESNILNLAEFASLFTSFLTFYLGQFTYVDDTTISHETREIVSYIALSINIIFLLFILYLIYLTYKEDKLAKKFIKQLRKDTNILSDSTADDIKLNDIEMIERKRKETMKEFRHFRASSNTDQFNQHHHIEKKYSTEINNNTNNIIEKNKNINNKIDFVTIDEEPEYLRNISTNEI